MEEGNFDVLISDIKMPGISGLELLPKVKELFPGTEVIIVTGFGSIGSAVEAMKSGAFDYITKPFSPMKLLKKVDEVMERMETRRIIQQKKKI